MPHFPLIEKREIAIGHMAQRIFAHAGHRLRQPRHARKAALVTGPGLVFGDRPARNAARLDPVTALGGEWMG
ncbi:MAG: hypothetical protein LBF93_08305 [Zoogloeaceae bacterium]|nr:hypothetical protein [Zoogloeaceae bacterium]